MEDTPDHPVTGRSVSANERRPETTEAHGLSSFCRDAEVHLEAPQMDNPESMNERKG